MTKKKVGRPPKVLKTKSGRPIHIKSSSKKQDTFVKHNLKSYKQHKHVLSWLISCAIFLVVLAIFVQNRQLQNRWKVDKSEQGILLKTGQVINSEQFGEKFEDDDLVEKSIEQKFENTTEIQAEDSKIEENLDQQGVSISNTTNVNIAPTNQPPLSKGTYIIQDFYQTIHKKDYGNIYGYFDYHMRSSTTIATYYNSRWLANFWNSLALEKIFLLDIIEYPGSKDTNKKYRYTIRYKLKNNSRVFNEEREAIIVSIDSEDPKIGSLRCLTEGCSKMPFFNPKLYE